MREPDAGRVATVWEIEPEPEAAGQTAPPATAQVQVAAPKEAGRVSVTSVPGAAEGPAFVTVTV